MTFRGPLGIFSRYRNRRIGETMLNRVIRLFVAIVAVATMFGRTDFAQAPAKLDRVDFVRDVQPIFRAKCDSCHGVKKQESAFRLDHKASAFKGGDLGRARRRGGGSLAGRDATWRRIEGAQRHGEGRRRGRPRGRLGRRCH